MVRSPNHFQEGRSIGCQYPSGSISVDFDRRLLAALTALLLGFGLLMVQSASITSRPTEFEQVYLTRHIQFLGVGLVAAVIAGCCPAWLWKRLAPALFVVTLLLLVAVLIPGVGTRVKGAQRWIRLLGWSLQPSELAKIAVPLMVAWLVDRRRAALAGWWSGTVPVLWPLVVTLPLILIQPDLGTTVFVLGGGLLVLYASGWPATNFLVSLGALIPLAGTLLLLKPYQLRRITGFLATWSDLESAPYQIKQSLVTLGAGGLEGVGLGRGWQKLSFLPEANTDFVFAVVGEELGLIGTLSVVGLWIGWYIVGLRIASRLPIGGFEFVVSFTLLTQLVAQALLNVGVVTALVPPKGISHPLISAGGSSMLVSLISLGMVFSLSRSKSIVEQADRPGDEYLNHQQLAGSSLPASSPPHEPALSTLPA